MLGMLQTWYTVKFKLNSSTEILTGLCKRYGLLYKGNARTFKCFDQKSAVFQEFQCLEKTVTNLKYFQALQRRVQTILCGTQNPPNGDNWFVHITHISVQ